MYQNFYRKSSQILFSRIHYGLIIHRHANFASTSTPTTKFIALKSIPKEDLGASILHLKENGSGSTNHDFMNRRVKMAKLISWGSSALGAFLIPYFTYRLTADSDDYRIVVFTLMCDLFIAIFTFTPLLLHFLTKRFPTNVYFNGRTQTFTTVHYNFFLQKRALRFKSADVHDVQADLMNKKLLASMATIVVHGQPILMPLDKRAFRDQEAFELMTKNVKIPEGHD